MSRASGTCWTRRVGRNRGFCVVDVRVFLVPVVGGGAASARLGSAAVIWSGTLRPFCRGFKDLGFT